MSITRPAPDGQAGGGRRHLRGETGYPVAGPEDGPLQEGVRPPGSGPVGEVLQQGVNPPAAGLFFSGAGTGGDRWLAT